MRVLYLSHTKFLGGGELQLIELASHMQGLNQDVHVLLHSRNYEMKVALDAKRLSYDTYDSPTGIFCSLLTLFSFVKKLKDIIRKFEPDLICVSGLTSGVIAATLRYRLRAPLVIQVMCVWSKLKATLPLRFIYRYLDGAIYNSCYTRDQIHAMVGRSAPHELVNYSLVSDPCNKLGSTTKRQNLRNQYQNKAQKIIGFIGRITPKKRVHAFMEMAQNLLAEGVEAQFLVIGDKDPRFPLYWDKVVDKAKQTLNNKIVFLGYVNDVADHMSILDVLVIPTYGEGFGRVALEAAYLGVPIVATEPSGVSDIIEYVPNSRCVSGDVKSLSSAVEQLLNEDYPKANPDNLKSTFAIPNLIQRELLFYETLIKTYEKYRN